MNGKCYTCEIFKERFHKINMEEVFIMNEKNRILIILEIENKNVLLEVVDKYGLIPAGHTDLLSRDPIYIFNHNQFIVNLDYISNIQDFIKELKDLGFDPKFRDIDSHEEINF